VDCFLCHILYNRTSQLFWLKELSNLRRLRTAIERGTDDELGVDSKERRNMIDELRGYENESVSYVRELENMMRDLE